MNDDDILGRIDDLLNEAVMRIFWRELLALSAKYAPIDARIPVVLLGLGACYHEKIMGNPEWIDRLAKFVSKLADEALGESPNTFDISDILNSMTGNKEDQED